MWCEFNNESQITSDIEARDVQHDEASYSFNLFCWGYYSWGGDERAAR